MSTTGQQEKTTWTIKQAPEHQLAKMYGITERQFRRAVQRGLIEFARPGGLVIRFTHQNIVEFIERSVNAPINRGGAR